MKPSEYIERGWIQFGSAKDALGSWCLPTSPNAVAWCLLGAVYAAYQGTARHAVVLHLEKKLGYSTLSYWNDMPERTKEEVLNLLKECKL